jgi:enamine deaminase RidA (YjgF/YER057c/UK114 family)
MTVEQRIRACGCELPDAPRPVGAYVPAVRAGDLVFTAGQLPMRDGQLTATGKVPTDVPLEAAQAAARQAVLNALAAVRGEVGELDRVVRVVRLNAFVNSAAGFTDQAKVANGASELLLEAFGDAGRHTRCAIGAAELPLDAPVELDLIVEIETD